MTDRRTYCIDSGWTNYFQLNVPVGTFATVITGSALYVITSLDGGITIDTLAETTWNEVVAIKYDAERFVAFRHKDSKSNVRCTVFSAHKNVTRR